VHKQGIFFSSFLLRDVLEEDREKLWLGKTWCLNCPSDTPLFPRSLLRRIFINISS